MTRAKLQRCLIINSPSILLMLWAVAILVGLHCRAMRVAFFFALATAFVAEERVKWRSRRSRREGQ
jgi:hypothetical protein